MNLGSWQLDVVSGGDYLIDGGTMFGVAPKALWEQHYPADDHNRIRSATHCVLARDGRHTVLVDCGYGGKCGPREREIFGLEPGEPLLDSLADLNVDVNEVDAVVLSHLHFDHAGGGTRRDARGRLGVTFPRARYVVQQGEWRDATSGAAELAGAYPLENVLPLKEAGQLQLVDGDAEILPGVNCRVTSGHTRWHQAILFTSDGQTAIYLGDLCPMAAHVRAKWCLSYDTHPLDTRRNKPRILGQAADEDWLVLLDHDPHIATCRLMRDEKREFRVVEASILRPLGPR